MPARVLELISLAGFEEYFEAMAELFSSGERDQARAAELQRKYHLELDFSSIPRLLETYGLSL